MRTSTLAASVACLFAFSASIAAPFPASNQNSSDARAASISAFQESAGPMKCKLALCTLQFPTVNNTEILIQHISCDFGLKTGGTVEFVELGNGTADVDFLSSNKVPATGADFYTVSAQAYFFVKNGQIPTVTVFTQGKNAEKLACTISGQQVPQSA